MLISTKLSASAIALVLIVASETVQAAFRMPFNPLKQAHSKTHSSVSRRDTHSVLNKLAARADTTSSSTAPGPGYLPSSYIIEFNATPGTSQASTQQSNFIAYAKQKLNIEVRKTYNVILNAVAINILDNGQWGLNSVTNFDGITNVTPIDGGDQHAPIVHATGAEATALRRRQSIELTPDPNAGKGVKVGVIDSGIDYQHPALGGCFGAGCKVAYGYDFVGDAYTGAAWPAAGWNPVPDSDPLDTCNGHGTHVAGLIAANSDEVMGTAPSATLGAYRVFGCSGVVGMDVLISAMERAATDQMDVISISIGTGKFYVDYPDARAAQNLIGIGITVVASAGNDGLNGLNSISSPGLAPDVISVGSMGRPKLSSFSLTLNDDDDALVYYLTANQTVVPTSTFKTIKRVNSNNADGCKPFDMGYSGKLVVLNRGGCEFEVKAMNAQNVRALGIIVVNDSDELFFPVVNSTVNIHVLVVGRTDGQKLYELLPTINDSTTIKWNKTPTKYSAQYNTYQWSHFSSNGPTDNISNIKPDLTSFGETVYSTFLTKLGSFALLSGTSMATPQVAGLAAATIQRLGSTVSKTERPIAVRRLLMQTAIAQTSPELEEMTTNKNTYTTPIVSGGTGIARRLTSSDKNWGLHPLAVGFRGTDEGGSTAAYSFKVTLTGDLPPGTVTFRHVPGWAASSWENRKRDYYIFDGALSTFKANPSKITISSTTSNPNVNKLRSESTTITIYPPYEANATYYMIFNGLVEAVHKDASTGVETIRHIPYQTTRGAQRVLGPLRRDDNYPRLDYVTTKGEVLTSTSATRVVTAAGDYVAVRLRLDTPSPWSLIAVEDTNGNILGMAYDAMGGPMDATKEDPNDDMWCYWNGLIQPMPVFNQPESSISAVPDGQYRLRLFTYRPFSPENSLNTRSSYDTWLSPVVTVTGIAAQFTKESQGQQLSAGDGGKVSSVMAKVASTGKDQSLVSGTMQLMYKFSK